MNFELCILYLSISFYLIERLVQANAAGVQAVKDALADAGVSADDAGCLVTGGTSPSFYSNSCIFDYFGLVCNSLRSLLQNFCLLLADLLRSVTWRSRPVKRFYVSKRVCVCFSLLQAVKEGKAQLQILVWLNISKAINSRPLGNQARRHIS